MRGLLWWQRHAARQAPCPRRGRLAAGRRAADLPRARHGRRQGRHGPGHATSTARSRSPSTDAPVGGTRAGARRLHPQQAARRRLDLARHPRPQDRRRPRPRRPPPLPGRPARRGQHRPDPADRRRRARPPPHAPELRGAQDLPRGGPQPAGARAALRKLREGIELDDGRTSPAKVRKISSSELEITIHEGRKRQIRRMCEAIDHRVESLERVAFGPLRLGNLPDGGHRRLTPAEVERLRAD